jgi:phenylpyruvate tautomerase PptA (4-oxalocrotonate tautomerase family)
MAKDNLECADVAYRIDVSIEEMQRAQNLWGGDGDPKGALAYAAAIHLVRREVTKWPKQQVANLVSEILLTVADERIDGDECLYQAENAVGAVCVTFV